MLDERYVFDYEKQSLNSCKSMYSSAKFVVNQQKFIKLDKNW